MEDAHMRTNDKLLLRTEVLDRTRLTTSSVYRLMRAGQFPEPIRIGAKAVRWPESEIEDWIASRPRASGEAA